MLFVALFGQDTDFAPRRLSILYWIYAEFCLLLSSDKDARPGTENRVLWDVCPTRGLCPNRGERFSLSVAADPLSAPWKEGWGAFNAAQQWLPSTGVPRKPECYTDTETNSGESSSIELWSYSPM